MQAIELIIKVELLNLVVLHMRNLRVTNTEVDLADSVSFKTMPCCSGLSKRDLFSRKELRASELARVRLHSGDHTTNRRGT